MSHASTFVGRARELLALSRLVSEERPLVTLFGPPGVGKTRLASEWLTRFRGEDPERTRWLCDLGGVEDEGQAIRRLASVLGWALPPAEELPFDRLGNLLDMLGPAVIVLDNIEGLVRKDMRFVPCLLAGSCVTRTSTTSPVAGSTSWLS